MKIPVFFQKFVLKFARSSNFGMVSKEKDYRTAVLVGLVSCAALIVVLMEAVETAREAARRMSCL